MAKIIDCAKISDEFNRATRDRVNELKKNGVTPKLAIIAMGKSEKNILFSSKRDELAKFVGIDTTNYHFDAKASRKELKELILSLNEDKSVHAILLESSLPKHLSFRDLINLISPEKDVDGLTTLNQGHLFLGEPGMIPCVPLAILHLLRIIHDELAGMHAVVLGRSSTVGRPLTQLLLNANCTVTSLHSYSKDLESICRSADILVSAVGKPGFVTRELVKEGTTVIDAGVNRIVDENGVPQIVGDVDFNNVVGVAGAITPVSNGIVPMTTSYLMHNTLKLACCS